MRVLVVGNPIAGSGRGEHLINEVAHRLKSMGCEVDVVNVLRIQLERMQSNLFPSLGEYNRLYGISSKRLDAAGRDVLVLHPGPMNRGVEIDSDVADGDHQVILKQVTNGVAVRMATLFLLAGGKQAGAAEATRVHGE